MRLSLAITLLVATAVLPLASAQVPTAPSPTATIAITGFEGSIAGLDSNVTKDVPVTVAYSLSNTVCPPGGATATVTLTATPKATPAAPFLTVTVEPATVDVTFPQGPVQSSTQNAAFVVKLAVTSITVNSSVQIDLAATATAPGCTPAPSAPAGAAATAFANLTAPPPPVVEAPPPAESPGPGALMGVVAACAAAAILRRRG